MKTLATLPWDLSVSRRIMTSPEDPKTKADGASPIAPQPTSFLKETSREVGKHLIVETGNALKWAAVGALIGAAALGGLGFWKFGVIGLAIGATFGAIIGGAFGGYTYLQI